MYRVEVGVVLQGKDGMMGLSRRLTLPFPPFEGLGLCGITAAPERPETVVSVAWDVRGRCFRVELLDCQSQEESLSELIDYYGAGWQLHEPGSEPVEGP
jgi:hypothetical protein